MRSRVYTAGPWSFSACAVSTENLPDRRRGRYIRPAWPDGGLKSICEITVGRPNWRENARLIAAAPALHLATADALVRIRALEDYYGAKPSAVRIGILNALGLVAGTIPFPALELKVHYGEEEDG